MILKKSNCKPRTGEMIRQELIKKLDESPTRMRNLLHIKNRGNNIRTLIKQGKIKKYRINEMNITIYYTAKSESKLPREIVKAMKECRRKKRFKNKVIADLVERFGLRSWEERNIKKHLNNGVKLELGGKQ